MSASCRLNGILALQQELSLNPVSTTAWASRCFKLWQSLLIGLAYSYVFICHRDVTQHCGSLPNSQSTVAYLQELNKLKKCHIRQYIW